MRQAGLDIGYDDFTRQRDYTRDQLNYLSSILQGVPIKPDQSVSTYTQQPGLFQTALSAGLGGLGCIELHKVEVEHNVKFSTSSRRIRVRS